jgi:hypothetical protein
MKVLILSILVVVASAQYYPGYYNYGYNTGYNYNSGFRSYNYNPYPYVPYSSSQYHSQDELGQASYGYAYPGQASTTTRDAFGNQIGSYAYINAEGKEVRVSYVADSNGFRVLSNDLPQAPVDNLVAPVFTGEAPAPVEDTPDVVAAKAEFFKLYEEATAAAAAAPKTEAPESDETATEVPSSEAPATEAPAADAPVSVEYTPEVVAARSEFFKLYDEAAAAAAAAPEERKKRSLFAYSYPVLAKSTIKTAHFEKDEAALTPAATTKIELKEQEHEIVTPVAYHAPVAYHVPVAAPVASRILSASPYYGYSYFGY